MKYFFFLVLVVVGMWSINSQAADSQMSFRINSFGPNQYDYSAVWNPVTQEATLRVGLVLDKAKSDLADKSISFSTARQVELVALDFPELSENCTAVDHWQFEYQPGLPNYLMFMTLKGAGCERVAKVFDILQVRLRFLGVSMIDFEPVDIAVEISR